MIDKDFETMNAKLVREGVLFWLLLVTVYLAVVFYVAGSFNIFAWPFAGRLTFACATLIVAIVSAVLCVETYHVAAKGIKEELTKKEGGV